MGEPAVTPPDGPRSLTRRGLLAAASGAVWAWPRGAEQAPGPGPAFRSGPGGAGGASSPLFVTSFIDHQPRLPFVHCPSLATRADGSVVCAWYAGTREGHADVAVWVSESRFDGAADVSWSPPRAVVDRESATRQLGRYVQKVGNPVIFAAADDRLWLVFVTIAVGGWSGSSLNACMSDDGGRTWSRARRLALSPFFNISELVRAAPALLETGDVALPVYHEFVGKFPEIVWLRPRGDRLLASKSRMTGGRSYLQPALVPLARRAAVAFLRDHSRERRVQLQRTADGGATWTPPVPTPLANPDASIAAVRLSDGSILMALNNSATSRESLSLVRSDPVPDDGPASTAWRWRTIATLEQEPGQLFAYPFLVRQADGLVHLVYASRMERIRHVVMNEAWLDGQPGEAIA